MPTSPKWNKINQKLNVNDNLSVYSRFISKVISKLQTIKSIDSNSNLLWLIITTAIVICITLLLLQSTTTTKRTLSNSNEKHDQIAVVMVAYHETSCIGSIDTALALAEYPDRVHFFISNAGARVNNKRSCLDGYDDKDIGSKLISEHMTKRKQIYQTSFANYGINAAKSDLLLKATNYNASYYKFVLEIHAHSIFTHYWDTEVIEEWKLIANSKAILTTYPSRASTIGIRQFNHNKGKLCNIICHGTFSKANIIRYQSPWEIKPPTKDYYYDYKSNGMYAPVRVPFWSSLFSFGLFEYLIDCPYDPRLECASEGDGIQFLYSMRLHTNGYQMYAPTKDIVFHNYNAHKFEQKFRVKRDRKLLKKDFKRMNQILFGREEEVERFGAGKAMSKFLYYKLAGIDVVNRTSVSLCKDIKNHKWKPNLN